VNTFIGVRGWGRASLGSQSRKGVRCSVWGGGVSGWVERELGGGRRVSICICNVHSKERLGGLWETYEFKILCFTMNIVDSEK
jgi:hypothetical protein